MLSACVLNSILEIEKETRISRNIKSRNIILDEDVLDYSNIILSKSNN
jgi:7,8-dihydro-6-hydroxymethylpterin-pyrophosphokinase